MTSNLSTPARKPARLLPATRSFTAASVLAVSSWWRRLTMGKKKALPNAQTTKAAARAAKKAKAAQKTERKEKRKIGKAKDEFDDDQDLEAILENVSEHFHRFCVNSFS